MISTIFSNHFCSILGQELLFNSLFDQFSDQYHLCQSVQRILSKTCNPWTIPKFHQNSKLVVICTRKLIKTSDFCSVMTLSIISNTLSNMLLIKKIFYLLNILISQKLCIIHLIPSIYLSKPEFKAVFSTYGQVYHP